MIKCHDDNIRYTEADGLAETFCNEGLVDVDPSILCYEAFSLSLLILCIFGVGKNEMKST